MNLKLRGKCKEYCKALCKVDTRLTLKRGWYHDDQPYPHWWCEFEDGTIVDPTVSQFHSQSGRYEPFDGTAPCELCGAQQKEDLLKHYGSRVFCSIDCLESYRFDNRKQQARFLVELAFERTEAIKEED